MGRKVTPEFVGDFHGMSLCIEREGVKHDPE